ncbi:MAG TPA: hypothetical protein VGB52_14785 [Actinomycetota bacterium]
MSKNKRKVTSRKKISSARRAWIDEQDAFAGVDPFTGRWLNPPCSHWRDPVEITQATVVRASAYCDRPPAGAWRWPDVGVYLCEAWAGAAGIASTSWAGPTVGSHAEIAILAWRDGDAPAYPEQAERVLAYALEAAQAGRDVEIGCLAGHGRTGTALAALMILAGDGWRASIDRVRLNYCVCAVETIEQERYLSGLAARLGRP